MPPRGPGQTDVDPAIARAFSAYGDELHRLALRLCGDPQVAEDATAETFAKVIDRLGSRDDVTDLHGYLRRTLVNHVNQWFRRRAVERGWASVRTGDDRGQLAVDDAVLGLDVRRALGHLPQRQRTVLVLRFYEHLSVAATAAAMGIAQGTVKSQTSRALETLRGHLEPVPDRGSQRSTMMEEPRDAR